MEKRWKTNRESLLQPRAGHSSGGEGRVQQWAKWDAGHCRSRNPKTKTKKGVGGYLANSLNGAGGRSAPSLLPSSVSSFYAASAYGCLVAPLSVLATPFWWLLVCCVSNRGALLALLLSAPPGYDANSPGPPCPGMAWSGAEGRQQPAQKGSPRSSQAGHFLSI